MWILKGIFFRLRFILLNVFFLLIGKRFLILEKGVCMVVLKDGMFSLVFELLQDVGLLLKDIFSLDGMVFF